MLPEDRGFMIGFSAAWVLGLVLFTTMMSVDFDMVEEYVKEECEKDLPRSEKCVYIAVVEKKEK